MNTYLRVESAAIVIGSVILAWHLQVNWWLFAVFAVLPHAPLLALLVRPRQTFWPDLVFNVLHVYATPILFALVLGAGRPAFLLGWAANIAADRLVGVGFRPLRGGNAAR